MLYKTVLSHLFNKESSPNIDNHPVRLGQLPLDVEGVCEGNQDVLFVFLLERVGGLVAFSIKMRKGESIKGGWM